jgi:hypothetical protein
MFLLDRVGLKDRAEHKPAELSGVSSSGFDRLSFGNEPVSAAGRADGRPDTATGKDPDPVAGPELFVSLSSWPSRHCRRPGQHSHRSSSGWKIEKDGPAV